jgi:hypothetical protein
MENRETPHQTRDSLRDAACPAGHEPIHALLQAMLPCFGSLVGKPHPGPDAGAGRSSSKSGDARVNHHCVNAKPIDARKFHHPFMTTKDEGRALMRFPISAPPKWRCF